MHTQVPSFDSRLAMAVLKEELGKDWTEIYEELTPEPIAAASLGQVMIDCWTKSLILPSTLLSLSQFLQVSTAKMSVFAIFNICIHTRTTGVQGQAQRHRRGSGGEGPTARRA